MAGQRHLVMKHRRIVSDTSALHLPMSLLLEQQQLQQQQYMFMPATSTSHHDADRHRYFVMLCSDNN